MRNCIYITDDGDVLLLIRGTTLKAASFELETYLLYLDIKDNCLFKNKKIEFNLAATEKVLENDLPRRYLSIENRIKVGFHKNQFYIWENISDYQTKTRDDVIGYLEEIIMNK